jgi:HTH-type transcriptional regulator/antitoxin MqsA
MHCPACGAAVPRSSTRSLPYTYKGQTIAIPKVKGHYCSRCGEFTLDAAETLRVSTAMLAFNKEVNNQLVDPEFIVRVRRKLALDQRQAAEIFGGGVNAFSRYEKGKIKPPLALVKLLKLLDRHPELLREVKSL